MNKVFGIVVVWCALVGVFVDAKNLDTARTKRAIDSQNNCENVIQFFSVKNITVSSEFGKGKLQNYFLLYVKCKNDYSKVNIH